VQSAAPRPFNGQDSILEANQNLIVDPGTQDGSSRGVLALDQACAWDYPSACRIPTKFST